MKKNVSVAIRLPWIFIFLIQSNSVVRGRPCTTRGWFGDNCQYKCHCTGNNYCDFTTGECTGGSACVKGWFGPACQYVDLTTTMTTGTGWLYDGDDATCNNKQTTSVTVELNSTIHFTWLRLYVKDTGYRDTFNVQFETSSTGNDMICNNKRIADVGDQTFDIYCYLDKLVKQVTITGEGVGSLCSVYISGDRNVALKQATAQSSIFPHRSVSLVSSNAVDGNRNGSWWFGSSCTQTNQDENPRLTVAFRYPQTITRYVLYNRNDAVPERLLYFNLTSYAQDGSQVFTYKDQKTEPQYLYTVIPDVTSTSPVSSVTITATHILTSVFDTTPVLTLCEVETYGDTVCPQGKYGRECEHNCDYCRNQICFVSTGGCPDGCDDGFVGVRCQTPCAETYYGRGCKERCSTNCMDQLCNNVNGVCDRCVPGKTGIMCNQDCPHTTYGQDCLATCSTNCEDQDCNPVSGVCVLCPPGKMGDHCDQICATGTYGQRCRERCSEHCVSLQETTATSCDLVNGTCMLGCVDGYIEPLCQAKASSDSPSSQSSASDLGVGIGIGVALMVVVVVVVAVGVYCYMKRLHNTRSRRQRPPGYDGTDFSRQGEHTYRELFKGNDDYNLPTDELNSSVSANAHKNSAAYENTVVNHYDVITEEMTKGELDGDYVNDVKKTSGVDKTDSEYVDTVV